MDPIRRAITLTSICNEVFPNMILKPKTVGIIPRVEYLMGECKSVEALQWLAYIGRTHHNVTDAGNGKEIHSPRLKK